MFGWDRALTNSNVNDMIDISTKTIQNVLSNFIPHQTITIDDKDPPWFNTKIKSLLQEKNKIYKKFRKYCNNTQLLTKLEHLRNRLNNSTDSSKHNYYFRMANKLNHSHKKWKDSLETRAALLIFSLELEISGMALQSIHQNSGKWWLLGGTGY